MIPTLPLGPRNRLAELILEALGHESARRELAELTEDGHRPDPGLSLDDPQHVDRLRARARSAIAALAGTPLLGGDPSARDLLIAAARLFDAGLYFEVHELLEPWWRDARGPTRESIQGLIQIAVGFQHAANGNLPGARSLLVEGAARLDDRIDDVDLVEFRRAVRSWVSALPVLGWDRVPRFPRPAKSS